MKKKVLNKYPSKTSQKKEKRNTFKTSQLPCLTVTHPNSPFFPTLLSRRRVRLTWSMIWSSGSGWCKWPRRNPSSRLALSGLEAVNWKNGFVREIGHFISFYTFYTPKSSNMAIEKWWLEDYFPLRNRKVSGAIIITLPRNISHKCRKMLTCCCVFQYSSNLRTCADRDGPQKWHPISWRIPPTEHGVRVG